MKRCFKCGEEKPQSEFYRHSAMADGLLGKCKDCTRRDVKTHADANIERVRAYGRERGKRPENIARSVKVTREWRKKHPGRNAAHLKAQRGHRDASTHCSRCGMEKKVERHHPDYSQPTLIEWLCKPCHIVADRERRSREATNV